MIKYVNFEYIILFPSIFFYQDPPLYIKIVVVYTKLKNISIYYGTDVPNHIYSGFSLK